MSTPTTGFRLLSGYCLVLLVVIISAQRDSTPNSAEAQFQERALEVQIRGAEIQAWLQGDVAGVDAKARIEEFKKMLNQHAIIAGKFAADDSVPAGVREQFATLWWLYSMERPTVEQLEALLPTLSNRGPMGLLVSDLAANRTVDTARLAPLEDVNVSQWLRSRIRAYVLDPSVPSNRDGPHAKSEKEYFAKSVPLLFGYIMLSLGGLTILLGLAGAPLLRRWETAEQRPNNQSLMLMAAAVLAGMYAAFGSSGVVMGIMMLSGMFIFGAQVGRYFESASPNAAASGSVFNEERWVGQYVIMAWFAFYVTLQLLLSTILPEGPTPAFVVFVIKLLDGFFAIWVIGQLGMAAGRAGIGEVLSHMAIDLNAFDGKALPALGWALAGYACSIPIYFMAAVIQSAFTTDPELVTNPIMPQLVNPSGPISQILIISSVLIVAPFFEECLFRGYFYRHLRSRMGVVRAVVISSVLFSAVHMNFDTFLPLFALASVLAIVTEKSGSILPAMFIHAAFNGANTLMAIAAFGG